VYGGGSAHFHDGGGEIRERRRWRAGAWYPFSTRESKPKEKGIWRDFMLLSEAFESSGRRPFVAFVGFCWRRRSRSKVSVITTLLTHGLPLVFVCSPTVDTCLPYHS
jgi:hypothetical protein